MVSPQILVLVTHTRVVQVRIPPPELKIANMRKNCRIWTCICGSSFEGRKAYLEHRKHCEQHLAWAADCRKRTAKTLKTKFANMTDEEKSEYHKKCSNAQIKNKTPEARKATSERTVFNNFWKYRSKNPITYESKIAGKVKLDSKWELIVAKRIDELGVCWFRPGLDYLI